MSYVDYPLELTPPDISPYRLGNTGVDYVTTFDSGKPGPHAMITAIVHGNELCGAIALDHLFKHDIRPLRGRLTLAFVNIAALQNFDPDQPAQSRFVDEDFNRVWSPAVLAGDRTSVELTRARQLQPIVDTVDMLLDIHSMQHLTAPLMMAGPLAKGRRLASGIGVPELVVSDFGHSEGTRLRDYGAFGDPDRSQCAALIECGQHWAATSAQVAIDTAYRFLIHLRLIAPKTIPAGYAAQPQPDQRHIEVTQAITINSDSFEFIADFQGLETIPMAGTVIAHDDGTPLATPYDDCVLIMPTRRLTRGKTAVRLGRYIDAEPAAVAD
ncbi:MAG: succinylglutamate desuccinylase [Alphaproteobacteria bacterium]